MSCYFSQEALPLETTPVENLFIIEHMPRASGPQLRVYLYGLMLCRYPAIEADIAQALMLTQEEVVDAFAYWQREGLVMIRSAEPLRVEYSAPGARPAQPLLIPGKYHSLVQAIQSIIAPRMLNAGELRRIYDWVEVYGIEEAAVLELVSYCYERKGTRVGIRYMEAVASGWADMGVRTLQEAKAQISAHESLSSGAMEILNRWNKGRRPTRDEIALYECWTTEWGFSPEAIQAACAATVNADRPSFAYLSGVLERLRGEGSVSLEAVADRLSLEAEDARLARQVFAAMGAKRTASTAQTSTIRGFMESGMPLEVMLYAAQQASQKDRAYPYFKRLMEEYALKGVNTLEEAKALALPAQKGGAGKPAFSDYSQAQHNSEALKHIYIDLNE